MIFTKRLLPSQTERPESQGMPFTSTTLLARQVEHTQWRSLYRSFRPDSRAPTPSLSLPTFSSSHPITRLLSLTLHFVMTRRNVHPTTTLPNQATQYIPELPSTLHFFRIFSAYPRTTFRQTQQSLNWIAPSQHECINQPIQYIVERHPL